MRSIGLVFLALAVANAVLVGLRRSAAADRTAVVAAASELRRRADDVRESSERRQALDALLARVTETEHPRDIGALRDVLVGAEHGLEIDRLSLDFRPEDRLAPGLGGSRVLASLRGRFEAVYDYLRRIEALYLPLSLESLALRGDATSVTLTVQWGARWPLAGAGRELELSPDEVSRLSAWLGDPPAPRPERDIFAFDNGGEMPDSVEPATTAPTVSEDDERTDEPERPVLTGFVLARPELEPDVRRRVLAALRFEGEMRLVMVGETVGGYVVDAMEARDSVTLTRKETGEQFRLTLQ